MLASMKKFLADRKGAFAIQFALMIVPLCVCTGLAIDGGRTFLARYELNQALDAAALAVGSATGTQAQLQTLAQTYVNANFKTAHNGAITVTLAPNASGVLVDLVGHVTLDTYFMPLVGQNTVTVSAESEVRRGGNNVEVALAIDITGSMDDIPSGDTVRKIDSLKTAAGNLIDTVISTTQPPSSSFYSRMAIVPWANNVYISDATLATTLRGPVTSTVGITGMTWKNGTSKTATATWRNGASVASNKITKVSSNTRVQLTFAANPSTLANGDFISVAVVSATAGSYLYLNAGKYMVADKTSSSPWTLNLKTPAGVYVTPPSGSTNATAATVQECFNAACDVRVTLATAYSPTPAVNSNWIFTTFSSSGTTNYGLLNTTHNTPSSPWQVSALPAPTSTVFFLENSDGPTNFTATGTGTGGVAQQCFQSPTNPDVCPAQVTAPVAPALVNGGFIRLTGISTSGANWSGLNNSAFDVTTTSGGGLGGPGWPVEQVAGNSFLLSGSIAPNTTVPSATGSAQCLVNGCQTITYVNLSGNRVWRNITQCVTERVMGDITGDTAPGAGQYLGRFYEGDSNGGCNTHDTILGLDDDRADLKARINSIVTPHGTTAGQTGIAWGEYMVSPNWRNIVPSSMSEFQPGVANQPNTSRVVVFMSDGEFNTAFCGGVQSTNYNSGSENDDTNSACNAGSSPFDQALAICQDLRDNGTRVYTVGFDVPANSTAWTFMQTCATNPDMAYLAATGTQLTAAFQEIADDISRLRLSR